MQKIWYIRTDFTEKLYAIWSLFFTVKILQIAFNVKKVLNIFNKGKISIQIILCPMIGLLSVKWYLS